MIDLRYTEFAVYLAHQNSSDLYIMQEQYYGM